MESQVVAALAASDYKQVSRLLKQWQSQEPKSPLLRLYAAQLQERTNRLEAAEKNYLKLLKSTTNSKLMSQARAGVQRIEQKLEAQQQEARSQQAAQKSAALQQARSGAGSLETTILTIAAPKASNRKSAIAGLAQAFQLDAYSARMKVPNAGFRIARVISWGEASYYADTLSKSQLPTFCTKAADIRGLQTFQVEYFEALEPEASVICKNSDGQLGKINFGWHEVTQRVRGQLPIFEQVIDLGNRGRLVHKEKVQDYAQVVDLHLPGRQIVLRQCDRLYKYAKSTALGNNNELNSRIQWNTLQTKIHEQVTQPGTDTLQDDFSRFGKGCLEFINLLPFIPANLDIVRRAPSDWDLAFHLYSSLCFFSKRQH